jgi:UDP-N-acetylmuramate--alanine ligase
MLAFILKEAGYSPSYAIGTSNIPGLEGKSHIGDGTYFVVEADEYKKSDDNLQPKFLDLPLQHVVITSIELDHPDVFQSPSQIYEAFYQLISKLPRKGTIVACSDWQLVRRLVSRMVDRDCSTYGFGAAAQYQIVRYAESAEGSSFELSNDGKTIAALKLAVPGRHNALNAVGALIMAIKLGVSLGKASEIIAGFQGLKRRFEFLGEYNGAQFYDDYAHHPTALRYLFEAVKQRFPKKRIIAVFQPHTYSRTGKFLNEFADALKSPNQVILLNIFASAREKSGYVTIKNLIDATKKIRSDVEYRSSLDEAAQFLKSSVTDNDVVLLIGAGDVYKIFDKLRD